MKLRNGEIFTGEWLNGKRHGIGILLFPNGDFYEGSFKNDRMDGFGKYTVKNKNKIFRGRWENNNYIIKID